jgi:NADPH-dependent 2,4-dienoyl-CoA reductase/sulfur reductase-like enzyme
LPDTPAGALIIGASQAGIQLACTLRELGYIAPITVIGSEAHAPYQRPPLSKALLSGTMTASDLIFRSDDSTESRESSSCWASAAPRSRSMLTAAVLLSR